MVVGDPSVFAIECYHEPLPNESRRVFGRMCVWADGNRLGDIDEPACMLNVTEGHLQDLLKQIGSLEDPVLHDLSDREAFDFLDRALYIDDERSNEEIASDAKRYRRFDFLTGAGESFDRSKSFIVGRNESVRILFMERDTDFVSAQVPRALVVATVEGFLAWLSEEGRNAG